jgi:addiction module RelE/StbE family toxin
VTQVRWTRAAADDLQRIALYLKEHQPAVAESTTKKIYQAAESLIQFPHRGRIGQQEGTRELVAVPLPYVIVYSVRDDFVSIARIVHGAQDWPSP